MKLHTITHSKAETVELAKKIGARLIKGDILTLSGDLGAGKTTFVTGVAKSLKIKDEVISPTFNILKCYFDGKLPLYHIDAYRLKDANKDIGLEEYIEGNGIAIVEWPIYIKELLNVPHLAITIKNKGGNLRELTFKAPNQYYAKKIRGIL
ncbi:MAG: tRNA (adenosine(37)-N6)-threonylcarbamoyltransferase complex ATPase subunit type 1 TsaE [Bacilli bacterium]|nr:tRNA (adenosine(37)-N6)-threonylcarbamoyltransferase complex ATPase subunit type 1 TsaE [Bacilli bacterium]